MNKDPFQEYMKESEPNKKDKGYVWHTAIGLQAVDGIKPSQYLIETAIKNIEGVISIEERSEEHTSELQSRQYLVCRLLLEKKNTSSLLYHTSCTRMHTH